jgi:long-chain acyl-CoA synthetase
LEINFVNVGCVISHESFICAIFGLIIATNLLVTLKTKEITRVLNYMPLAHMFGCGTIIAITYLGGEIGFWQGKVDKLIDDFRDFRPTILTMVPRLLNKLYDKVRLELRKKGFIGRILFQLAVQTKLALIRRGNFSQNTIWDKIIFNKIRQSFGGQVNRVISTSAPLSAQVCGFSRAVFSCLFIECYGQTECVIGCSQTPTDMEPGETGIPTSMNYIKLVDVPEKDYYAKDNVGEICIRSPALFKGYLKDEAKTRETIDEQGWLHTGDIGRWTPYKTMRIVDRKKNMYKVSINIYLP